MTIQTENNEPLTAPKKNGGQSANINSCATNKHCAFRQVSAPNPPQRKAPARQQTLKRKINEKNNYCIINCDFY